MGSNKFVDGLLWGILIGGAGVFLFGTKKGNKLWDIIREEGGDSLNKMIEEFESQAEDVKDEVSPRVPEAFEVKDDIVKNLEENHIAAEPEKRKVKRFFRSSKK